jgi:two-component system, cell cycle sensor histidine kinase and response regulator CckA
MGDRTIRILQVEDNPGDARLVREMLKEVDLLDYSIEHVMDLTAGRERVVRGDVDVVLLDLGLPDSQGVITLEKLISDLKRIPAVIVMTGHNDKDSGMQSVQQGAQDYLVKDHVDGDSLSRSIHYALERNDAKEALQRSHDDLENKVRERTAELSQTVNSLMQEVADRERAEKTLRRSEELYRSLFDDNPSMYFKLAEDGTIISVNHFGAESLGYRVDDLVGTPVLDLFYSEDREMVQQSFLEILANPNEVVRWEFRKVCRDGHVIWVKENVRVVEDVDGERVILVVCDDISGRKQAEDEKYTLQEQLTQAQKLESIGRLAGGVAHDFNNMLTVILGHVDLALFDSAENDSLREHLEGIQQSALRSADLTRQLLAFARKQTVTPEVLNLNETIDSMFKMLRRLIGEDVGLSKRFGEELKAVRVDPGQVDQLLANLVVNAYDAIGQQRGQIVIETANVSLDEDFCAAHLEGVAGDHVMLSVRDDGCGMDLETQAKIFEPFFTTKGVGEGTGLGLATIYGIVKQNKGMIDVESELGEGTTFRIYLPAHKKESVKGPVVEEATPADSGNETILLVEDEVAILNLTRVILEKQGYLVLSASTPGDALRKADEFSGPIDLLMTDVIMPEMNGRELSEAILELYPSIHCLFMSGYTADVIACQGVIDDGVNFIQKPFAMKALALKVKKALRGPNG